MRNNPISAGLYYKQRESSKKLENNWDKVFGTSTCERIAEQLLKEDKALCDRLNKQDSVMFSEKVSKVAIKDLLHAPTTKAADTMKQSTIQV